jgi:hypothetical protein
LAFVGTTSLYGTGSSQYNRLHWPATVLAGSAGKLGFFEIGQSRSFGTSQFSDDSVDALVRCAAVGGSAVRVNSLFGEGVSPRLRKIRIGLAALGWPANELLRHGRTRLVYGAPLVENLCAFALGIDKDPRYSMDVDLQDDQERLAAWWYERWASKRITQESVLQQVRSHVSRTRPVRHGARVSLPSREDDALFGEDSLQA